MVVGSKGVRNDHMNALVVGLSPRVCRPLAPYDRGGYDLHAQFPAPLRPELPP